MEKTTRKKICNYLKKLNNYKLKRNADRAEWKELFNYLKRLNKYKLERNEHKNIVWKNCSVRNF